MITVKELIEISHHFNIRVNGDDYDKDVDHYADDWIVDSQHVDVYANTFLSSCDPDEVIVNTMYLYINAEEPESND